jgi:hypothetical protein
MPTYAHIINHAVAEIFVPPQGFSIEQCFHPDLSWTDVSGFSPMPQAGWSATQDDDGNWTFDPPGPPPAPTIADQAMAIQMAGMALTSNGTPALNGTYAADDVAWANILAIETSLLAGRGFPGGLTTINYPDKSGAFHNFNAENFTNFAVALRDFVFAIKFAVNGGTNTFPKSAVTIL